MERQPPCRTGRHGNSWLDLPVRMRRIQGRVGSNTARCQPDGCAFVAHEHGCAAGRQQGADRPFVLERARERPTTTSVRRHAPCQGRSRRCAPSDLVRLEEIRTAARSAGPTIGWSVGSGGCMMRLGGRGVAHPLLNFGGREHLLDEYIPAGVAAVWSGRSPREDLLLEGCGNQSPDSWSMRPGCSACSLGHPLQAHCTGPTLTAMHRTSPSRPRRTPSVLTLRRWPFLRHPAGRGSKIWSMSETMDSPWCIRRSAS